MFHLLKASLGTGILAMPNAFHNAGYAVGMIGTLIVGFLCTYNVHMLVSKIKVKIIFLIYKYIPVNKTILFCPKYNIISFFFPLW